MSQSNQLNNFGNYLRFVAARRRRWRLFVGACEFVAVVALTSLVVSFPAYVLRTKYLMNPTLLARPDESSAAAAPPSPDTIPPTPTLAEPRISNIALPKIGVSAPIIWNVTSGGVQTGLRDGVVQIAGTASPGTPGNIFITGHSSDYWWTPGNYKSVFALLDKMEAGDEIGIEYKGFSYKYRVYNKAKVSREDVSQFVTTDKKETLTLMTCWPVGTNWRRIIVQAERVN